jgi:hypothetical protein
MAIRFEANRACITQCRRSFSTDIHGFVSGQKKLKEPLEKNKEPIHQLA